MSDRSRLAGVVVRCRRDFAVLLLYAIVAALFFGLRLLLDRGSAYVGTGVDPQIFIWSFAWWPHAILHGANPIVTHAIWAPDGVNLAWTTSTPGLALLFAPLTLAIGAVNSFNTAAVLMPAFAAYSAFLLCRHLTGRTWASLAGGYLFGFSSYMLGQEQGHMHMTSVFLVPLVALVILRFVEGTLDRRGLLVRLGPLLALELLFSTELLFTLTLALACALLLGVIFVPDRRRRIIDASGVVAVSYLLAAVLTAPFVYYLLTGFQRQAFHPPQDFVTDLLNVVVPTRLALTGHGWAASIAAHFPGNDSERGAYLGLPTVAIILLFAWRAVRTPGGRFLLASLLAAGLAALGPTLTVDGNRLAPLPWEHIGYLPLFNNVLVIRLTLFVALAAAVIVALWVAACRQRTLRWLVPLLAVAAIVPDVSADAWTQSFNVPAFFTDETYRDCLNPGENILPLPVSFTGNANLWQVESGLRFTMAGGYVFSGPPSSFLQPAAIEQIAQGNAVPADQASLLEQYVRTKHVTSVVVDKSNSTAWSGALDRLAPAEDVGGVLVYRFAGRKLHCGGR